MQASPLALVLMSNGPYALNVTLPVGLLAPVSVAVSLIVFVADSVCAVDWLDELVVSDVQLVICTPSGATKSFSSSVNVFEERLLRYTEPKVPHPLSPENSAL